MDEDYNGKFSLERVKCISLARQATPEASLCQDLLLGRWLNDTLESLTQKDNLSTDQPVIDLRARINQILAAIVNLHNSTLGSMPYSIFVSGVDLFLDHCLQRLPNVKPPLHQCLLVLQTMLHNEPTLSSSQQTQNICITFIQRRPSVFDVGPTLYKYYTNVLCLLGCS